MLTYRGIKRKIIWREMGTDWLKAGVSGDVYLLLARKMCSIRPQFFENVNKRQRPRFVTDLDVLCCRDSY